MHIVLVSRLFGNGGIATYNRTFAKALTKSGHKVTIVTTGGSAGESTANLDGVSVVSVPFQRQFERRLQKSPVIGPYVRSAYMLSYSFEVAKTLNRISSHKHIDVVEFADVDAEGFFYLRQSIRAPVVVRCHTPAFVLRKYYTCSEMPYDTTITAIAEKYCIRRADLLTAPSCNMADTIAHACGVNRQSIQVIPNPLEMTSPALNESIPDREVSNASRPLSSRVLFVGRLERVKGIETLISAMQIAARRNPDTELVIVGGDRPFNHKISWKQRLQFMIHEKGIEQNVKIVGSATQGELHSWYQSSNMAVVPSLLYESFSYTCAQAMSFGLPVVASRIGGTPETVRDGVCGLIVEPGDPVQLGHAILFLSSNEQTRRLMGQAGKRLAGEKFDSLKVSQRIVEAYRKIVR